MSSGDIKKNSLSKDCKICNLFFLACSSRSLLKPHLLNLILIWGVLRSRGFKKQQALCYKFKKCFITGSFIIKHNNQKINSSFQQFGGNCHNLMYSLKYKRNFKRPKPFFLQVLLTFLTVPKYTPTRDKSKKAL